MTRVFAWNWHTPYWFSWRRAMPEDVHLTLASTSHAPFGWREDQRPLPEGISIATSLMGAFVSPDVVILQTPQDIVAMQGARWPGAALYLSHNRADMGEREVAEWLNVSSVPLLTISPMKAQSWLDAGYRPFKGGIPTILPGIDVNDYGGWTGEGGYVLTVANNLRRPLFDAEAWIEATRGLPVKLVGEGNEGIPGAVGPAKDWDELRRYYREAVCYLSVNKWPNEDGYNLSLLEAAATGMPCFTLAKYPPGTDSTPRWTCMRFDAVPQLRGSLAYALQGVRDSDRQQGAYERECVARDFSMSTFRQKWLDVLSEVAK